MDSVPWHQQLIQERWKHCNTVLLGIHSAAISSKRVILLVTITV